MPIQIAITQPNGTTPAYHVIQNIGVNVPQDYASVAIQSWMDQAHFASQAPSVAASSYDISALLIQPAPAPSGNFGPQIISVVEQYLLTLPTFSGGSQVS